MHSPHPWSLFFRLALFAVCGAAAQTGIAETATTDGANGASPIVRESPPPAWNADAVRLQLEALARSTDIAAAREAYLKTVFAHAWAEGRLSERFVAVGNPEWLEAATRLAERPEDRTRAFILWAHHLDRTGTSFSHRQEAGRAWAQAVTNGRETDLLPHALLGRAHWQERHGRVAYDADGVPRATPDPAAAVSTLDELLQRFGEMDSPLIQQARALRARIFAQELRIEPPFSFRPEADVRVEVSWRNLADLRLSLWPVKLAAGEATHAHDRAAWIESLPRQTDEPVLEIPIEPAEASFLPRTQVVRLGENLPAGAYRVEISSPENHRVSDLVLIGEAALVLHAAPSQLLAQAVQVQTGQPLPGVPVTINRGETWSTLETDPNGLAIFPLEKDTPAESTLRAILESPDGLATAVVQRPQPAHVVAFEHLYFASAARTHYRRGETVHFRVIGRRLEGNRLLPLDPNAEELPVRFAIMDNREETVSTGDLRWTAFGTASGEVRLNTRPAPGQHFLALIGPNDEEVRYDPLFFVQTEDPPLFRLAAEFANESHSETIPVIEPGAAIDGRIRLVYFQGNEPIPARSVQLRVFSRQLTRFPGDERPPGATVLRETLNLTTDSRGEATFRVITPADPTEDMELELHFSVEGGSRPEETLRRSVWVSARPRQITLQSDRQIVQPGESITLIARSTDLHAAPTAAQGRLRVTRDRWRQVFVHTRRGTEISGEAFRQLPERALLGTARSDFRLQTEGFVTETLLERPFAIDATGRAEITIPALTQGFYRAIWISGDGRMTGPETETEFWVVPVGDSTLGYRPGGLRLIVDSGPHEVGDTVSLLLTTDQPGAHVLLKRGDNDFRETQLLELTGNARHIRWTIEAADAPNTHLFATTLLDGQLYQDQQIVSLTPPSQALRLQVTPNAPGHGPGDAANATILVRDSSGQPVTAELAVSLTSGAPPDRVPPLDTALKQTFRPDPRPWRNRLSTSFLNRPFFRPDTTGTGEASSATARQAPSLLEERVAQQLQTALNRDHLALFENGAQAFAPLGAGHLQTRENRDLLWYSHLATDENGQATIEWTFPRELGTWTLDIVAVDRANAFGTHRSTLQTKQPLVLEARQPAFLHAGDVATISVSLTNSLDYAQDVEISLAIPSGGLALEKPPPARIRIEGNSRLPITARIRAETTGTAEIHWSAATATARDDTRLPLDIHPLAPPPPRSLHTRITSGQVDLDLGGATGRTLHVRIAPGIAPFLLDSLERLLPPDLHTLDQIAVRSLLPLLVRENLATLGYEVPDAPTEFKEITGNALSLLRQTRAGQAGWPWFPGANLDAETTALIISLIHTASDPVGILPSSALLEARSWLTAQLDLPGQPTDTRANILHALALRHRDEPGVPGPEEARAYLDLLRERNQHPDKTLARLAQTAHRFGFEEDARLLLGLLRNRAQIQARRFDHFARTPSPPVTATWGNRRPMEPGDTLLATTAALSAWLTLEPGDTIITATLEGILDQLAEPRPLPPVAIASLILALGDYLRYGGELDHDHRFTVALNGRTISQERVSMLDNLNHRLRLTLDLTSRENRLSVRRDSPEGPLYMTIEERDPHPAPQTPSGLQVSHRLYRIREVPTLLRGFREERTLHPPGQPLLSTDRVEKVLILETTRSLRHLILADPRSAAFEPPRFPPNESILLHPIEDPNRGESPPLPLQAHPRIRPLDTLFHIEHLPPGSWELPYRMRLDSPGTFQHPLLDILIVE